MKLTAEQRACVRDDSPLVVCLASPGSGKTTTMAAAIHEAIRSGRCWPGKLLAVTFTRLAASRIRRRVHRDATVGTFHAVCHDLVCANWRHFGFADEHVLVYDDDQTQPILYDVVKRRPVSIRRVRQWMLEQAQTGSAKPDSHIEKAVTEYRFRLKEHNAADYTMLVEMGIEAVSMFQEPRWDEVYIDEAQDLDPMQVRFFKAIRARRVFLVGDPDQNIFSFRHADASYLTECAQEGSVRRLTVNFRSRPQIVGVAAEIIRANAGNNVDMKSGIPEDPHEIIDDVLMVSAAEIPSAARALAAGGCSVAILARRHDILHQLSQVIPEGRVVGNRRRILADPSVRCLMAYLAWPETPRNPALAETVLSTEGVSPLRRQAMLARARTDGIPLLDVATEAIESLREFYDDLASCVGITDRLLAAIDRYRLTRGGVTPEIRSKLIEVASEFVRGTPFKHRTCPRLLSWLNMADDQDEASRPGISLLTIHAAKGLEFDHVILAGVNDGIFPDRRSTIEEERRLLFVAVTRARYSLVIGVDDGQSAFVSEVQAALAAVDQQGGTRSAELDGHSAAPQGH